MGRSFGFMKQKGKYMVDRFMKAQEMSYQSALQEIKKAERRGIGCGIYFRSSKVWAGAGLLSITG